MNARTIVISDIDAAVTEHLAALFDSHGYRTRIAIPVHAAVSEAVYACHAHVCMIDPLLRDGDDIEHLRRLTRRAPTTAVIARTADVSAELMRRRLEAGVAGYVHKSIHSSLLLDVVDRVANGETVIEGAFTRQPARSTTSSPPDWVIHNFSLLTPRERECLMMMSQGHNTAAIAASLSVTTATVRTHAQSILSKLGVRSRLEAASMVYRWHLANVPGEESDGSTG